MKNLIIKALIALLALVSLLVMTEHVGHAYTVQADGSYLVTSGTDMTAALKVTNANASSVDTIVFANDIYINNSTASNYTISRSTNIDFAGHAVYGNDHGLAFFTVTGAGSNIYVKNMNMQSTSSSDTKVSCPTENGSSQTSNTGYSRGYYGVFYGVKATTGTLTYENCTWSFPNTPTFTQAFWWQGGHIILKGNNNIIQLGDQELAEAYAIEIQPSDDPDNPGVTTFQELYKSDYNGSIAPGVNSNMSSSSDPMLLRVAQGATLNWTSARSGNIWYGTSGIPLLWDIQGTFNYQNTATTKHDVFQNTMSTFTLNIGSQGNMNFKGTGPLFEFSSFSGAVVMNAADGANVDIENNLSAGVITGTATAADKINLGNVASAKFAASAAPVFGTNTTANALLTINTTQSMRSTAYADQAATNPTLYMRGNGAMAMKGGYGTPWSSNYTTANMTTLSQAQAHVFSYPQGLNFMDSVYGTNTWPTNFGWSATLFDLPKDGSKQLINRDNGNTMTLGIYDDRDVPAWTLSASVTTMVNDGKRITRNGGQELDPLVWVPSQGATPLQITSTADTATGVLKSSDFSGTIPKASDYAITYPENLGLLAALDNSMLAGDYSGTITWTLNDGIQ
ncbi:hypothetical protein EQG49_05145 [Periweissella cryptocerci]|uniref:WxL domain-containing protein n=1 Tax=Periweissella cryptocerci TaxID=2506420 RepID=A0A4V1AIL1_9LACO|nr:hypothetical protein [Periweissella cryptocerci]QBO35885.1 hypothetical protein EQG49_05145 [Periweissella cryptocerci]